MNKRTVITVTAAMCAMLLLIFDGQTAMDGVRTGLDICLRTLIPSLFPFFVLSGIITATLTGHRIPWLGWVCRFCHMPNGSESFLAIGLLAGYPVGAGNLWTACQNGSLTHEDANRLAVFCNNAGPAFIFGVIGQMFPDRSWVIALWLIQVASALLSGFLLSGKSRRDTICMVTEQRSSSDSVSRAIKNMASVCGWVILFRMILCFLDKWVLWLLPISVRVFFYGTLELSNGCLLLPSILSVRLRFLIASVMLSFGGLCILMQTRSVFPAPKL